MAKSTLNIILKVTGAQKASSAFQKLKASVGGIGVMLGGLGVTVAMRQLLSWTQESIRLAREQAKVEKQLDTVIQSTGAAAGMSALEVKELASELQQITNFGDEATLAGQNLLLTFTNIGRDVFPAATRTMLDMSAALGQGLKESAIQLGKALNEPITGVTALRRVGVQFSDDQERMIKSLAETGRLAEAQTLILAELNREFRGSAEAAREADAGYIGAANAIGDLREAIGEQLMPTMGEFNELLAKTAETATTEIQNNAKVAKQLGLTYVELAVALVDGGVTLEYYELALKAANEALEAEAELAQRSAFYTRILGMSAQDAASEVNKLTDAEQKLIDTLGRGNAAAAARAQGLAAFYRPAGQLRTTPQEAMQLQQDKEDEAEEVAKKMAAKFSDAMEDAARDMATSISSAVSTALSQAQEVMPGLEGLLPESVEPGEFARRMGALADGLQDSDQVFLEAFKQQAGGNPIYAALLQSLEEGDSAAVGAEASRLMSENLATVFATGIVDSFRAKATEQDLAGQINAIVSEQLGEQPIGGAMQIVTTASSEVDEAQADVKEGLDDMGLAAKDTGEKIKTAFGETTLEHIGKVRIELGRILGILDSIPESADGAGNALNEMGVGGTGDPAADARNKSGGMTPL